MKEERELMDRALKDHLVPALRSRGFKGSFPHFHRIKPNGADYLTVQFASAGGSFVVEIAKCGPEGAPAFDKPLNELNTAYFRDRLRLGSRPEAGVADHWFEFGRKSYDPPAPTNSVGHYARVARSVLPLIESQADGWWNDC